MSAGVLTLKSASYGSGTDEKHLFRAPTDTVRACVSRLGQGEGEQAPCLSPKQWINTYQNRKYSVIIPEQGILPLGI